MEGKEREYHYQRVGDIIKVEIRDQTYRILYRTKFNITDKNSMLKLIEILEKFSGFSVLDLMKEKLKMDEWI